MLVAVQPVHPDVLPDLRDVVARLYERGAEAVELRLDFMPDIASIEELFTDLIRTPLELPWIATLRKPEELGHCLFEEEARLALLAKAVDAGAWLVDIECESTVPEGIDPQRVLRSHHHRAETNQQNIATLRDRALATGYRFKSATLATSLMDNVICRDLLTDSDGRATIFCMGERGTPSRILGKHWGNMLTYAASPFEGSIAPGILSLDEMVRLYNYHEHPKLPPPALYGVVGKHVATSLSPFIHNTCFRHAGSAALYLPLVTDSFGDAKAFAEAAGFSGLSVTIPFKNDALTCATQSSEAAETCGAANTLSATGTRESPQWSADNTDSGGFLSAIDVHLSTELLAQSHVLVLGYGGSARAIVHALKGKCRQIYISGRDREKAEALAWEFGVEAGLPSDQQVVIDLVVNCTPVGMRGGKAAKKLPIDLESVPLSERAYVYDLVYDPPRTPLVHRARKLEYGATGGLGMLVQQALLQQEIWGYQTEDSVSNLILSATTRTLREPQSKHASLSVALVGYRCSGKSSVGRLLAGHLNLGFVDLDEEVETMIGKSVAECFSQEGESGFRQHELEALRATIAKRSRPFVLATGGGCIETPEVRRLLSGNFCVVALKARESVLLRRLETSLAGRPRLEEGFLSTEVSVRLSRRHRLYERIADLGINTDGVSVEGVAKKILLRLYPRFV